MVVDRAVHHLFSPLLYQVATGVVAEGDIAPPLRNILRRQTNTGEVLGTSLSAVAPIDLCSQL